jgi:integrase/recombinase XerD
MNYITIYTNYLETLRASRYSPRTVARYADIYEMFGRHVGDCQMHTITPEITRAYFASLTCGRKTASNYHTALATLWSYAVKYGICSENVINVAVDIRKPEQPAIIPFCKNDIRDLLQAAEYSNNKLRNTALILLLLDTGLRSAEACALVMSDIYWISRKLKVCHGKGDKSRVLKFSQTTEKHLLAYIEARNVEKIGSIPLFASPRGEAWSEGRVYKIIAQLARAAGVVNAHPHRFRHTFAIQYLRNGGNIYALQKMLGHTTLEMCRRYLAINQADIDSEMERCSPVEGWRL